MYALIIEPSRLYQEILTHVLKECEFQVAVVKTGNEALRSIKQQSFDLICVSMYLSDISAPDLCMRFRTMEETLHKPIIMITAEDDNDAFQKALVAGATEAFHKKELSQFTVYLEHFLSCRKVPILAMSGLNDTHHFYHVGGIVLIFAGIAHVTKPAKKPNA